MSTLSPANDMFSALYASHHGWLYNWLWRKLGCRDGAADLAQDTFVRMLAAQSADSLREPRAYLSTVANGLLVNHWRRLTLERTFLAALASRPELTAPSPEERALVVETLCRIDAMLDTLSPRTEPGWQTLPAVSVSGSAEAGYLRGSSSSANRSETAWRDTPQAVSVVTAELIRDQDMRTMADAMRYMPGVGTAAGEGKRDTAVFRGNSSTSDFYLDARRRAVLPRLLQYRRLCHCHMWKNAESGFEQAFRRHDAAGVQYPAPAQVVWQVARRDAMKRTQPATQAAVVGVHILHMHGASHTHGRSQVDCFMHDAELPGKRRICGMAVRYQQNVAVDHGRQAGVQPGLGQLPQARHEIDGLPGAVARHQHAHLFM